MVSTLVNTKLWIYQINRKIGEDEQEHLEESLNQFLSQWQSHGSALKARGYILYNLFLIVELDPTQTEASGCSIDKLVKFLKEQESRFDFSFFDRTRMAYWQDDQVVDCDLDTFRERYRNDIIDDQTPVFNTLLESGMNWETNWLVPLKESWHKRLV